MTIAILLTALAVYVALGLGMLESPPHYIGYDDD